MAQKHTLGAGAYTSDKPSAPQIALTSALVDEIIRVCTERGVPILILNIPMEVQGVWMQNMVPDRLKLKDRTRIVDVAKEVWQREDIGKIATKGSYHPKARGHELIADWLADYIRKDLWKQ